ncbi:uncharacterized protein At1g43920, Chloroplastic-like [Eutrema salsugineum]|uniref:uncharacterized protein At1g43920, Chloroplastic-like n=1 Tax=Eutrema salsugineum TaxID=72664 RepID=UPI000CECF787|nr:uncharacterized protein At1g43920, Chloroplastic-like [Eutrema salsugineum]
MSCNSALSSVEDRGREFPSKCHCGRDVVIFTSKTQENPGRPFFRSPTMKDNHLFKWVEDGVYEEVFDALPRISSIEGEIENAKFDVGDEIEGLKGRIRELEEDLLLTKREINNAKLKIKCMCFVCLCVTVFVIVMTMIVKTKKQQMVLGSM